MVHVTVLCFGMNTVLSSCVCIKITIVAQHMSVLCWSWLQL